ncbi:hypothetical protein [Acetobacter sp.]|uniref:hypothetical protein n=1 Tax=Acetobacter sp. TaxID=440 RepID=UPI0039EA3FD5
MIEPATVFFGISVTCIVVRIVTSDRVRVEFRFLQVRYVQKRIAAGNRRVRRIMARNARRQAKVQRWIKEL